MGWVPPQLPERPEWMSDEQYADMLKHEMEMLQRLEVRVRKSGVRALLYTLAILAAFVVVAMAVGFMR